MRNAVQPCPPLVVRTHDIPGCVLAVSHLQHHVPRSGIVVPALPRLDIHRAQFPLPQRVADARRKSSPLLVHSNFHPQLDQRDAAVDDVSLDLRAKIEKPLVFLLGTKSHDVFDPSAVVPAAVEDHDLARRRELLHVALHEHLRFFAIRWSRKRDDAKDTRAYPLGNGFDGSALTGSIASLEHDDDPQSPGLHPVLQVTKLHLELAQLRLVDLAFHLGTRDSVSCMVPYHCLAAFAKGSSRTAVSGADPHCSVTPSSVSCRYRPACRPASR